MASRTLLQWFTLSIIITYQIEAKTFDKTHDLEKNQEYDLFIPSVNKRPDKAYDRDRNDTVVMKKMYPHFDQRSDTNAESRHDILSRNKYSRKYKQKGHEEADSEKSQAEPESDDSFKSITKTTSNRIEPSVDNRKKKSNEGACSEETSQVSLIKRKFVAEAMSQTIVIEKIQQEGETKLEPNYESSLQNYVEKDNHPTVNPFRRQKQLTVRNLDCNEKIRTTQATRQKRDTEVENEICKTKHCDYRIHRSFEKKSREHDVYELKRRDEFKTASKHNNNKKVNKNNTKIKHYHNKSHRTSKTISQENSEYESKDQDIEKPVLKNTISMENEIYEQNHIDDFATVEEPVTDNHEPEQIDDSASIEEPVSIKINPESTPKLSHNFQKQRQRDKKVRKVKHTDKKKHNSKTKHDSEKAIPNQTKYKPTLDEKRDSVSEKHTDIRKGENVRNANLEDTLSTDDTDNPTLENQDEKETLESYDEQLKQNDLLNKPRLPFYVSSTTKRAIKDIFKKQPKKPVIRKDENETNVLLTDLNTVLKGKSDLRNQSIDLNEMISRLASSKILDFITDVLAGHMLKKFEIGLASKNHFKTAAVDPEKVEQIDILFKKDGDMVMMGREHVNEKEEGENVVRGAFDP